MPLFIGDLKDGPVGPDGYVADQDVYLAKGFDSFINHCQDPGRVGNVSQNGVGLYPQLPALGGNSLQFLFVGAGV